MLIKTRTEISESQVTDEKVYLNRRAFLAAAGIGAAGMTLNRPLMASLANDAAATGALLPGIKESPFSTAQQPNSWQDITTYNNFYEFGQIGRAHV